MMDDVCTKAGIRDGMRVLDIGCGFGALCSHLLREFPHCTVTGLNLSSQQCAFIETKQRQTGHPLADQRFRLIRADFNNFTSTQKFDRIVSLGFFEHIQRIDLALHAIAKLLAKNGKFFVHFIVSQWRGFDPLASEAEGFIEKFVFPGGHIYPFHRILEYQADLQTTQSWFLNGKNYQKTLEHWLASFLRARETIQYQTKLTDEDMVIWEIYLRGCIAMFKLKNGQFYGNGQYLCVHR